MMRRYDDIVQVRCARAADEAVGSVEAAPQAFVWRGRSYVVRRVLDRWVERTPWWRTALEPRRALFGEVAAAGSTPERGRRPGGGPVAGLAVADLENPVWRIEAAAGRRTPVGVYDLSGRADGSWRLLRVGD